MLPQWYTLPNQLLKFEQQGLVTRTFRRLDPQRQQAVIGAILEESASRGPAALSIKQVAQRAGVSVGSLYQYFGSRAGLMSFAVALCVTYLTDGFDASRPYLTALPLREALQLYLNYGIEWSQTQLGFIQFFGRAAYQGDPALAQAVVQPVATAMRTVVEEMLAAAAARGEIRPDLDLPAAARAINALLVAVGDSQILPYLNTYLQVTGGEMPYERVLQALLDLLERGLAAPAP